MIPNKGAQSKMALPRMKISKTPIQKHPPFSLNTSHASHPKN
jgi:hypothetical protein